MTKTESVFLLMAVLFFSACNLKPGEEPAAVGNERVELTPFIIHEVLIRDTTQIRTLYAKADSGRMSIPAYLVNRDLDGRFLDIREMRAFRRAMWKVIQDPRSKICTGPDLNAVTTAELRNRIVKCDSIRQSSFDAEGKEFISTFYACDSTSDLYGVDKIRFFEARYFNTSTGQLEIETLGYSLLSYMEEKGARKELFCVFKNEEAMKKAKQFYTN
ncbi:MAG: hypothetical protein ACXVP0_17415 [Bacteroidia bacterium]